MTDSGVFRACAKRVYSVCTILAVVFGASAAQAGAWDAFEQRCLVPMENVELTQPGELKPDKMFKNDGNTYSTYDIAGATLAISDLSERYPHWCWLQVRGSEARVLQEAAFEWSARMQSDGRYEFIEDRVMGFVLRSVEWREPKIEVSLTMAMKGGQFTLRVVETDLES